MAMNIIILNRNDVLFGRGFAIGAHPGNQHLRQLVQERKSEFEAARKKDKKMIAIQIVHDIATLDPPGRFLIEGAAEKGTHVTDEKQDVYDKVWVIVEEDKAINKVMHRLRERDKSALAGDAATSRGAQDPSQVLSSLGGWKKNEYPPLYPPLQQQQQVRSQYSDGMPDFVQSSEVHRAGYDDLETRNQQNVIGAMLPDSGLLDEGLVNEEDLLEDFLINEAVRRITSINTRSSIPSFAGSNRNSLASHLSGDESHHDDILINEAVQRIAGIDARSSILSFAGNNRNSPASRFSFDGGRSRNASFRGSIFSINGFNLETDTDGLLDELDNEIDAFAEYESDFDELGEFDNEYRHDYGCGVTIAPQNNRTELTLREWIEQTKSAYNPAEYLLLALPVALKLTDNIIETEPPLTSIIVGNVVLMKFIGEGDTMETIDNVQIKDNDNNATIDINNNNNNNNNNNSNLVSSGVMDKLRYLGLILYELFSGCDDALLVESTDKEVDEKHWDLDLTDLSLNSEESRRIKKRSSNFPPTADMRYVFKLESLGVPYSLTFMVKALLDCGQNNSGDYTFQSFYQVKTDLELMLNDPSRFLVNIDITNGLPSLKVCDKLYGRESEIERTHLFYQQLSYGMCNGIAVMGESGVGKSKLAMHIRELTVQAGGYFLDAKFDQNNLVNPLSRIAQLFNSLCDLYAQDALPAQLKSTEDELKRILGSEAFRFTTLLPGLSKLLPSISNDPSGSSGVDNAALSMMFLVTKLLDVISASLLRPITFFLDDIQWADPLSLSLLGGVVSSIQGSKTIFFACCCRSDLVHESGPFSTFLGKAAECSVSTIKLGNLTVDGINHLLSDTLHLSPRITRPLASVLLNKTRGNCLSLLQMLVSLKDQGLVYVDISKPCWSWDINKIIDLEVSHDVVVVLVEEMRRLPPQLQLGLHIASCLGHCVKSSVIDILSMEFCTNLPVLLRLISEKGFLMHDSGDSSFTFVHDKIQQAAKELMSEQQRLELHMQLGLAICSSTLEIGQNDELFFMSVNQINCGGKGVLSEPSQANMVVALNIKAGELALIKYTDSNSALKFFKHGISFLENDHWQSQYLLSKELFDLAATAACNINDAEAVRCYADQVFKHATCFDDTLNCLFSTAKALAQAFKLKEYMMTTFAIIEKCGEEMPQPMNEKVVMGLQSMIATLHNMTDESILSMTMATDKRVIFLMKVYAELANMLHFIDPSLLGAVSLRLADLTLRNGLTPLCPLAFVYLGAILLNMGTEYITQACRLGRLALKLVDEGNCSICKSSVIMYVYQSLLFVSVPLQAVVDAFLIGRSVGERSGNLLYTYLNHASAVGVSYWAGANILATTKEIQDVQQRGTLDAWTKKLFVYLQEQCNAIQHGGDEDSLECILELVSTSIDSLQQMNRVVYTIQRLVLFRRVDIITLDVTSTFSQDMKNGKHILRPILLAGIFLSGLVAFQSARRATDKESQEEWYEWGVYSTKTLMSFSVHSSWNWENKALLLSAEKLYTNGDFDSAASIYDKAICSANEHRFVHEEAIASELAGDFYYERNFQEKSMSFFKHSLKCYLKWGATAVAKRLQNDLEVKFGLNEVQNMPNNNLLDAISSLKEQSLSRKW